MSKGLIIEGGGMRGIFATGVIEYLLENNIILDNVIAVSAGACHACSYVALQKGRAFHACVDYMNDSEYSSVHNLRKTGNLFGVDFIYHKIPEELFPIDNEAFKKSGIKFQVAVTNCETGLAEYPVIEDLIEDVDYVLGSSSLPMLAKMVPVDGKLYMDGGIADSIPIKQSIAQGNTKNVVILTRNKEYRKGPNKLMPIIRRQYKEYPEFVEALETRHIRYNETLDFLDEEEEKGNVFIIRPMGPLNIGRTEKDPKKLKMAANEGYFVAEGLGEKLKAYLEA